MSKNSMKLIAGPALGVLCAGTGLAQNVGDYEALDPGFSTKTKITAGVGYRAESDLDEGGGSSSMFSARIAAGTSFTFNKEWGMSILGSYTWNHYDWKDVGLDPWRDIHSVRVTPLFQYHMDDKWTFFGGPSIGFAAEDGSDLSTAFSYGAIAGVHYMVSDKLTVGLAVGVFSRIEDDAGFLPVPIVNWQFADDWMLKIGFQEVAANGGVGAEVTYALNDQWKVGAGVQFEQRRFRLAESGPIPSGVGRDRNIDLYLKAGWQATPRFALEGVIGVTVAGEYRVEDDRGHKLGDTDYDPAALIGLRALFTF